MVCSPRALKAEIIPMHPPEQEEPRLEPQGLSAPACSWGFFICHLLTFLNNDHKLVTVHTRSKSLSFFGLSASVADIELVVSLQICCSEDTSLGPWEWRPTLQNHTEILEMLLLFSSHSSAFLLLGVQLVHRTWAMGLLLAGLWPKPPPCRAFSKSLSCPS